MLVSVPPGAASDPEEIDLLREVAGDIAYALRSIDIDAQYQQARAETVSLARFPGENPSAILRSTGDGTLLYANPASAPLLAHWGCGVGGQVPEEVRRPLLEAHATGTRRELELGVGGAVYSLTMVPIPGAGYVNVYGADVTERRKAERSLRDSEERYRSLFDNMAEGLAHCRMLWEGDRPVDFEYLDVNGMFEAQTGLKDVVGRRVTEVIPGIRESLRFP